MFGELLGGFERGAARASASPIAVAQVHEAGPATLAPERVEQMPAIGMRWA